MILLTYRHGLRASEVTDLKWEQVDFDRGELHVNRLKGGTESTHPLTGRELREHKRESPPSSRFELRKQGHRRKLALRGPDRRLPLPWCGSMPRPRLLG
jgi:integrase